MYMYIHYDFNIIIKCGGLEINSTCNSKNLKKTHLFACFIHVNFLKYEYNTGTVNWIQVQFAVWSWQLWYLWFVTYISQDDFAVGGMRCKISISLIKSQNAKGTSRGSKE